MRILNWVLAGIAVGVVASALLDPELRRRLTTARRNGSGIVAETEPVLGYDGMDQETLLEWLPDAGLDGETLENMLRYEEAHLHREPVITTLREMLG